MTTISKNILKKTLGDDAESRSDACKKISERVLSNGLSMEDVYKNYSKELGTTDETVRYRALRALNDIFIHIASSSKGGNNKSAATATTVTTTTTTITDVSARTLTRHYIAKLEDELCYPEVVRGMRVFVEASGRAALGEPADAGAITLAVISNACAGTLSPDTKYDALKMASLGIELSDYSGEEAVAILMSVRGLFVGERNTRVLLEAFGVFAQLLARADPGALESVAQSVFDSFSSYFPILFVPSGSPVDKDAIVAALRRCFAASPVLAPLAVPFLVDKTASSIATARSDAFRTLAVCVKSFGPEKMPGDFLDKLTMSLRCNGFVTPLDDPVNAVLECVTAVHSAYTESTDANKEKVAKFIDSFVKLGYTALFPPPPPPEAADAAAAAAAEGEEYEAAGFDEDVAKCGAKYLSRIVRYNNCGELFLSEISAKLSSGECDPSARHIVAAARADLAESLSALGPKAPAEDAAVLIYTAVMRDLSDVRSGSTKTQQADIIAAGGRCLGALAKCSFPKCSGLAKEAAEELARVAAAASADENVASAAVVNGLCSVGAALPSVIVGDDSAVLAILLEDPSVPATTIACAPSLACANEAILRPVVMKLAEFLGKTGANGPHKIALVSALGATFRKVAEDTQIDASALGLEIAQRIAADTSELSSAGGGAASAIVAAERTAFAGVAEALKEPEQLALIRSLLSSHASSSPRTKDLLYTAAAALSRSASEKAFGELIPVLAVKGGDEGFRGLAIASLLNKCAPKDASLRKMYDDAVAATISEGESSPAALAWVTRGLMQRSHPRGPAALAAMISLCSGSDAGASFRIVAAKECLGGEGLVERCGAVLRDNYSEKVFNDSLSPLLALHAKHAESAGPFLALAALLADAPPALLTQSAPRWIPVAVRSLDFVAAAPAGLGIITTLNTLLLAIPRNFEQNIERLVARLCGLAVKAESARCRAEALATLTTIRNAFNDSEVIPFQDLVTSSIKPALDDKKRPVRAMAVACINAWYIF